jgi:hypothetical protein
LHEELEKEIGAMPRTPKQEDFLATARKSQEIMVDAIRTWVETVRTATPRLSAFYAPFADRLSKVPSAYMPRVGQLPTPKDAVASAYDLAERLLASQRKFAEDVVKATAPLMPGFGVSKPQDHRETAPQDHGETAPQDHSESAREDRGETAPRETAAESIQAETVVDETPKAAAPRSATKTAAAKRAPRSTAASRAPKTTAAKRAPKNSDAG